MSIAKFMVGKTAAARFLALFVGLTIALRAAQSAEPQSARERLFSSASAIRQETAQHPFRFRDLRVCDVFSPPARIAGAGFLLKAGNQTIAVTAGHPHPNAVPTKFIMDKRTLPLGPRFRDANDISCFTVNASGWPVFNLIRLEGRVLKKGDTLAVVGHDGVVSGKLLSGALGTDDMLLSGETNWTNPELEIAALHDFSGNSGAPVILEETGEVIGVLQTASTSPAVAGIHGDKTTVGFALLSFDAPVVQQAPSTVFSFAPIGRVPAGQEAFFARMIPWNLLDLAPGMPMKDIFEKRPYLPPPKRGITETDRGSYRETLSSDYLFQEAGFTSRDGKLDLFALYGPIGKVTAPRVEAMFDWFFTMLGQPSEAFTFDAGKPVAAGKSVYCRWNRPNGLLILGGYSGPDGITLRVYLAQNEKAVRGDVDFPRSTGLPAEIDSLRREIRVLTREAAKLSPTEIPVGAAKK